MATVKFVGYAPRVSDKGVTFDKTKEDRYLHLGAALQLVEAFDIRGEARDIIYRPKSSELSETVINEMLQKYCPDLDARVENRKEEAKKMVEDLRQRVTDATTLSDTAKRSWLANIDTMIDYYTQYITNETAYNCIMERLSDEVVHAKIKEIKLPLLNHFGLVLHELGELLERRRPPVDSEYHVEQTPEGLIAVMKLRHT